MNNIFKTGGRLLFLSILFLSACHDLPPTDIRNDYLKGELTEADYKKGKELLAEAETAYGGRINWEVHKSVTFTQTADWYGRKAISHWDTVPQKFKMEVIPGSFDCRLELLNGKNRGSFWGIESDKTYSQSPNKEKVFKKNKAHADKMIFKNYWFQFPFRISEAEIISYAGEEEIDGKKYDLVYATWGSISANNDFDQFILYLNKETHLIEYLHFTVREKMNLLQMTARFDDFRKVGDFTMPFSQFVRAGAPKDNGLKMHENHYESIEFWKETSDTSKR